MADAFAAAVDALTGPTTADKGLGPLSDALPATGVAISTLGAFLGNETVAATDEIAARLDELQFDLGEGPCWDAFGPLHAGNRRRHRRQASQLLADSHRNRGVS
ncbi:hypothetical protein [Mycetocola sp.]|uniref:hypothetical protein n=1 Tax=Mycetocola sp. TaxID=1871042 RepID=UPI00398A122B